jgi:hypothetical protein
MSNVDDTNIIDWICIRSNLIIQPETNEHYTKTENRNTLHKMEKQNTPNYDGKSKPTMSYNMTTKSQEVRKNTKNIWKPYLFK